MRSNLIALCALALGLGCAPEGAPVPEAEAAQVTQAGGDDGGGEPSASARGEITTWARAQRGDFVIEPITMLFGDFTGDGAADALVFVYTETGGSAVDLTVALFRNQNGRMVFLRTEDNVFGFEPRDASFAPGQIRVTTSTLQQGDPHCCPTGQTLWTIDAR